MNFLLLTSLFATITLAKESQVLKNFVVANSQFTGDAYKEIMKFTSTNFVVCPISAEIILALLYTGAGGQTALEISTALYLPENKQNIQKIFQELTTLLNSSGNSYTLSSANKMYIKHGCQIKNDFKDFAVNNFNSDIENIDFTKQHDAAAEINRWVEKQTHHKITDVVNADSFKKSSYALLINTMHFHGKWISPFSKQNTNKKEFYLNNQSQIKVNMMEQTGEFKFYYDSKLNAQFLEMPYVGDGVTMTIVLPNDLEGLSILEARIADVLVAPPYFKQQVHIVMPKFTINTKIQFSPILRALGIVEAFQDTADFDGMLVNKFLKIDEVIQKAFIEVDEEGTVAAAATYMVMAPGSSPALPLPVYDFIADHPFIFYIKIRNVVLFVGRYSTGPS